MRVSLRVRDGLLRSSGVLKGWCAPEDLFRELAYEVAIYQESGALEVNGLTVMNVRRQIARVLLPGGRLRPPPVGWL